MNRHQLIILAIVWSTLALAATAVYGRSIPQTAASPATVTPAPVAEDATHALLRQSIDQQFRSAAYIARASQAMHDQIESLRPSFKDKVITAGIAVTSGLVGALIGALSSYALQRSRLKSERTAARQAAGLKELSEIKQFRGRQLNEFYAPLEALLKQGLIVRNELYTRLEAANNPNVAFSRLLNSQAANGWSLGIAPLGHSARPFRLLEDLALLQAQFPAVMGTVGEIVRINQLIAKHIHEKIGLVLHGSDALSEQLGVFLAHQTVLEDMFAVVQVGNAAVVPQYTTTFPRKLQPLVVADCTRLRDELKAWQATVSGWMGDLYPTTIRSP